ncbi:DUF4767 domain-containing protein [Streptococcus zalophi]|uniref:DUF4767 domain-containing protein n=1 Tax=Streptococcus zalophi TaxID=640031 RepID=A0A934P9G1_9STRE|nr:DUF4767 domain-containing protein [Streptococcus zalophi]MBJ8349463.1 DUF4767 domain-containing protein [Streptococcus zalophi]
MKKNKYLSILFGVGVLVGVFSWFIWGNPQSNNNDNKVVQTTETTDKKDDTKTTENVKKSDQIEKEPSQNHLWTVEKAQALQSFIGEWQVEMNQIYTSYTPDNPLNYYGYLTPKISAVGSDTMTPALNDSPINVEWSDTGDKPDVYNLVAVYSDYEQSYPNVKHLYYFVIKDGQALVLHTSQNQGNENNWLYFTETENIDLKNGFKTIVGQ